MTPRLELPFVAQNEPRRHVAVLLTVGRTVN